MFFLRSAPRIVFSALVAIALVLGAAALPAQPDVASYPMGATVVPAGDGGGVVFRTWAPNATAVSVRGEFNGWDAANGAMTKDATTDIWSRWVSNAQVGQAYKIWLQNPGNNDNWRNDPWARDTDNTMGNSFVTDRGANHVWNTNGWVTPDINDVVIYEMHVGTFSGNGDGVNTYPAGFRHVVDAHLDELLALGVNMVEIMPPNEFPGGVSWGYNPVHYYALESNYGSPADLRYMIQTLQANGIGVLVDVVYNHTSTTDNNLWDFDGPDNIWFYGNNCQGDTPWGSTRPDYHRDMVRSFLIDNVTFWHDEYNVDGLRFDATRYMRGYCDENGAGWSLLGQMSQAARGANPGSLVIAEDLPNDAAMTRPIGEGGAGFTAQWGDYYHDTMRDQMPSLGAGNEPNLSALRDAILYTGFDEGDTSRVVKFSESHDEAASNNGGSRLSYAIDQDNQFSLKAIALTKLAAGLTMVSPGVPMLLQGQEFMENKPFGDQQSDRIWWGFLSTYFPIRDYYARLISLRLSRPSLRANQPAQQLHYNSSTGAGVLAFQRWDSGGSGDVTVVVVNFGQTDFDNYRIGFPSGGRWYELVNSQDPGFMGDDVTNNFVDADSGTPYDGQPASAAFRVPSRSMLVFSKTPLDGETLAAHGVIVR